MATQFKTTIKKNTYNEWVIRSITLVDEERSLQLTITTTRNASKQLVSYAVVGIVDEENNTITHRMCTDFHMGIDTSSHKRLTLKIIEEQHNKINMELVVTLAKAFYTNEIS
jgi:hypothetical protein